MRAGARLLVIGPDAFGRAVRHALPAHEIVAAEHALEGVWKTGTNTFEAVVLSLMTGPGTLKTVRSLREVVPQARIVVTCSPAEEPDACRALDAGADEYVLEPLAREELEEALRVSHAPSPPAATNGHAPSLHEIGQFSEILRRIGDGALVTLERLAALLQETFGAAGAALQLDDLTVTVGQWSAPVLEQPILRQEQPVGRIALARRTQGAYTAATAGRLAEYAPLIEATVAQARESESWRNLAWLDDLTGLHNRRYFERTLEELLARAGPQRLQVTVLLFDVDAFKTYNDSFGHEVGDGLLREVAVLLRHCSRKGDIVARYGGDEFAVVFWDAEGPRVPGSKHPTEPIALAERFRRAIGEHNFQCLGPNAPGTVTISGGLACFPWDGANREQLLRAADEALLNAKRTGKNRIELAGGTVAQRSLSEPE